MRPSLHSITGALLAGAALVSGCAPDEAAPGAAAHDHATPAEPTALSNDAFAMTFALDPAPTSGRPTRLSYTPLTAEGTSVTDLVLAHEKLSHLVVVSRDLARFDHVHPERQPDGSFAMPYTFPVGGEYVLFADFLPAGADGAQVFAHPVRVGGETPAGRPLGPPTTEAAEGGLTARLATTELRADQDVVLTFRLADADGDVRDVQPYLGAAGHVVVIPEGAGDFLHVHPVEDAGGHLHGATASADPGAHGDHRPSAAYGPVVRFATTFPAAGRYKLWLQVQRAGRVHTLPFVLDVA